MDDLSELEDLYIAATGYLICLQYFQNIRKRKLQEQEEENARKRQKRTRKAVKMWFGHNDTLLVELEQEDLGSYRNYLRMEPETFKEILDRITPRIQKEETQFGNTISPRLRLSATLRFLATGASSKTIGYAFRISYQIFCTFLIEVCQAIIDEFSEEVIVTPTTPEAWKEVAKGYWERWNFPHCIGAIDGKHVALRKPRKSGSEFHNYKGFFSIVLLAIVDSDYKFLYVDVGQTGCGSDAGVFSLTEMFTSLNEGKAGLPEPEPLPGEEDRGRDIGYFLVGDDAFALKPWMMKPIPQRYMAREKRIFNYRLSRARRVVENVFGILSSRFRCLLTTMQQEPDRVATITMACCVLHNLLRLRNPSATDPGHDGGAGDATDDRGIAGEMHDLGTPYRGHNPSRAAKEQRDYLLDFVNSPHGSVPWQDGKI